VHLDNPGALPERSLDVKVKEKIVNMLSASTSRVTWRSDTIIPIHTYIDFDEGLNEAMEQERQNIKIRQWMWMLNAGGASGDNVTVVTSSYSVPTCMGHPLLVIQEGRHESKHECMNISRCHGVRSN
jgi:hypothetical protein